MVSILIIAYLPVQDLIQAQHFDNPGKREGMESENGEMKSPADELHIT